ncbi:MAG: class I SAM-dependent methyltransferase [Candidatus Odinarchaeota archaeon]
MDKISGRLECKVCKTDGLVKFIDFGKMPIANAFVKEADLDKEEYMYDMAVGFCEKCKMVQLVEMPPYEKYIIPDEEGKTQYAFFSSTSKFMEHHFAEFAEEIAERFLEDDSKVLEIGSNDGIMLKAFKNHQVLGIEPSQNVAEIAINQGIETITEFFTELLAGRIGKEKGKFRAILTANVFLNIIEINEFMRGVVKLLDNKGVFVTEDPYIIDILEKNSYDQIYDEHVWYFSLTSLSDLFDKFGMEIFDAKRQWVHGGSMRVYSCKKGTYEKTRRFQEYLDAEKEKRIDSIVSYQKFAEKIEENRKELTFLLKKLKSEENKIVGYAAASKGTIVMNYCDISKEILEYITDSTPFKQGKYSPGKHIPIVSPEVFHNDKEVNYALLFAWNHAKEIIAKEKAFLERNGKFIVHLPRARIIDRLEDIEI